MARGATQQFLEFDQVREGIIVMKNKTLRGVLAVSSLNFALKPQDEQDATIYLFQDFLNSLDFFLEIYVQSRKLNITGYLEQLKKVEGKQANELLLAQTRSYRQFIEQMVAESSIMTKSFYVVVPFSLIEIETPGVGGAKRAAKIPKMTEELFGRARNQLWQRMEFVALGLKRMGIRAVPLTTPEIIELLWSTHHPEEAESGYYPELPPELMQK